MKKLLQEFKEFISRGNVLDMAVGVVIASAFTAVVNAAVSGLVTPIIGLFIPNSTFAEWAPGGFAIGAFVNAVITFLITAAVIFLVMKVVNAARNAKKKPEEPAAPTTKTCPYCLSDDVKIGATKCPHCASELPKEE
ncbi:MAG: large conductance mechanosensitive channel protein MscL [Firmicutes bacterium]|uniref:Large-conductance mechanosensitive channel n=1 Tax=Anaeromassilibacillus senegalensis TaxID=1673717 RepID=A0ABS9CQ03_9FIRM|nr:large conductance mechanosensitive channel protein MscL [Anaeromassilibacillus senegalensis]MCF2653229.1 large conductance mechanosensitive channel protein MscL [Anaeromassilibacillus senegalensis]MCI5651300.1 large conductance mechanosensitive channel protein MscL [Ruminococcus bromii]MDD7633480.1 large conductance mechanosensitive channel protein MscL [Bacillota bacterium]MDY4107718.1 large conductance mechanosensitive channel protein MscL [Oscillospiraceae bacterium]